MGNGFFDNTNQPSGAYNGDFSGQLNDMLAPYQQMAQKFSSPYATMNQNSWLAKNHPQVAGILDNAFLTAGSTPQAQGPEGVGGGIARTMQGLMGGQQFQRQRMMQQAMLPYQMMQPMLQSADTMSQIQERREMVPFRKAQEQYMMSRDDNYQSMIAGRDRQKALAGPDMTDDKGQAWSRVFDPVAGKVSLKHAVTGQDANDLPADQRPTFKNQEKDLRRNSPGGLLGEAYDMMDSADPAIAARGKVLRDRYVSDQGAMAGVRTGATQAITEPAKDLNTFVHNERQAAYGAIPKPMNQSEFYNANITNADYWKDPQKAFEQYQKGYQGTRQQMDVDLSKYEKSSAPRMGVSFQEYMNDRNKWDGSAPNPAPATPSQSAPAGSGSTWTPKKN